MTHDKRGLAAVLYGPPAAWPPLVAFGGGAKAPPPPPDPLPVPDIYDPGVVAARRKRLETLAAASGRRSTNLTDDYSADKLGLR